MISYSVVHCLERCMDDLVHRLGWHVCVAVTLRYVTPCVFCCTICFVMPGRVNGK